MKKNALEWFVFVLSLLLILGLFGYLGRKAFSYKDSSPDLRITINPEPDQLRRNIYHLEIINKGEQTAENVMVEVTLLEQGKEVEKAESSFPMVPEESKEEAWVTFKTPIKQNQKVSVHILGYNKP